MTPIKEICATNMAVVGNLTGRTDSLPAQGTLVQIATRVFRGSTNLSGYLAHYAPVVDGELSLPSIAEGKLVIAPRKVRLPFGGAMRRGFVAQDHVTALLASASPQAMIVDVQDGDDADVHPALEAALLADGLATLLDPAGPFSKLDLATADGLAAARQSLGSDAASALTAPARCELLPNTETILLPAVSDAGAVVAFAPNRAQGIAATMTQSDLAALRKSGIAGALSLIEGAHGGWREVARAARADIYGALQGAVDTLAEKVRPLQQVWLSLAMAVRSAAKNSAEPVATLDLDVEDLLVAGDGRVPMADDDRLYFQQELFNAVVTPMTAVDLSPSVSMVLLAQPVKSLGSLEVAGNYAQAARTMVFASMAPADLGELKAGLDREAFQKDDELWKRYVSVYAPSVRVAGPAGMTFELPAAAAVVAELAEVKTLRAGPGDTSGEYANAVAGSRTPILRNGHSMPGAEPWFVVNDTALHQRMALGQVTLLYHSHRLGTFASDADTLYASNSSAEAIYGVSTATMLTNYLTRTIAHHMRLNYDGKAGTAAAVRSLEQEIRALIRALDNGTEGSSRKILVAEQTSVAVALANNGRELDVKLTVGVPNRLVIKNAPDVEANTALVGMTFDQDPNGWLLKA